MTIPDVAARGFGSASDAYERGRPSYPREAVAGLVEDLGVGPSSTLVDVAAGTGKFTRLLGAPGRDGPALVVAVEPVAGMRDVLAEVVVGARIVAGVAEAIPLATGSADAVVAAQAFHWFRVDEALAEAARVLRPGGGLAMLWNDRDETVPWVARLSELVRWHDRPVPAYHQVDWVAAVAADGRFEPLQRRRFRLEQELDASTLVDRVLSTSYIAAWPASRRDRLAASVVELVADLPEPFVLPYRTDVFWCRRR